MQIRGHESRLLESIRARGPALLNDLRLHVGIPTGGNFAPGLEETRERLTARLGALGAAGELVPGTARPDWLYGGGAASYIPPTAVCRRPSERGARLLISGHLDTVHDPNGPFRELNIAADGKKATGPGCVDMKGGLVIAVHALEALEESGIDVRWTAVFNSDEETGSYHSEAALRALAPQHDLGLVLEPALPDGGLVVERPGSGQFMVEVRGRAAHVGRDFASAVSAVNALAGLITKLAAMARPAEGLIVNVGPIEGGNATNVVPDRARAWGNVRFKTAEAGKALERQVLALATVPDAIPRVEVKTSFNRPAKPLTDAVRTLAETARAAAEDLGQKLPFGATGGVCDGNILQDAGLPTIDTLGVRGGGLHTPQEWIELDSLVERCSLLAVLIVRLSGRE
jgi:glutamate carboxypeptidase